MVDARALSQIRASRIKQGGAYISIRDRDKLRMTAEDLGTLGESLGRIEYTPDLSRSPNFVFPWCAFTSTGSIQMAGSISL